MAVQRRRSYLWCLSVRAAGQTEPRRVPGSDCIWSRCSWRRVARDTRLRTFAVPCAISFVLRRLASFRRASLPIFTSSKMISSPRCNSRIGLLLQGQAQHQDLARMGEEEIGRPRLELGYRSRPVHPRGLFQRVCSNKHIEDDSHNGRKEKVRTEKVRIVRYSLKEVLVKMRVVDGG